MVNNGVLYDSSQTALLFVPRNTEADPFEVPQSVTIVGAYAFGDCTKIKSIRFAGPVASLGTGAFAGSGLTALTIPATVKALGDELTYECASLTTVTFERPTPVDTIPAFAFAATGLTEFLVPKSITTIREKAFAQTPNLTSLLFEPGSECTTIGEDVFWITGLTQLELPKSMKTLQSNFFTCGGLSSLRGGGKSFFEQHKSLFNDSLKFLYFVARDFSGPYEIPDSTECICGYAFCDCGKLTAVHFGASSKLLKIDVLAFFATEITEIVIPPGVIEIGESSFGDCTKLKRVEFRPGSKLQTIGPEAFRRSGLEAFTGPPLLSQLGYGVFAYCPRLKSAVLPPLLLELPEDTFTECNALDVVRTDAPPGKPFTVHKPAFPERFRPNFFRHQPDLEIIEIVPEWLRNVPSGSAELYERKRRPGTPVQEYLVDDAERVQIGDALSHTAVAQTYKARHVLTGEISLVKEFGKTLEKGLDDQREIFARLVHPAVLGMIGAVMPSSEQPAKVITEFMPHGSLEALVRDRARYDALTATAKVKIVAGILLAMRYIHACQIFHRDLKPSNILLDENDEVRVGDFRLAKIVDFAEATMTADFKAHFYMAPDMAEDRYGKEVDVYSFGMILWELLSGKNIKEVLPGARDPGPLGWQRKIKSGWRPPVEDLGQLAGEMLALCWHTEPKERRSFEVLFDTLKENKYALLPDVVVDEIEQYIARIEEYENENPPPECQAFEPADED